ncbi:NAD-dependent epimerase/dehydratase family protein [Pedobacter rhodius]|uniref:NAD-dependent epimerase/dehydratase family protein n=1 Tax=Pedobacter rhodius TaxID=3004098 RepID=A0ABT4L1N8_9SPHI|nr:NAD-dependent epimerase/dehydratase family protein [Pedobacter sp. SJ11]MCZ4224357.1 NAD-dependent epimerase/dehydratase family protein [Pedobacter sp. SJ11]
MRILLTGATGFLGLAIQRHFEGHEVVTVGRSNCEVIAHLEKVIPVLPEADLVIHAAGKAHSVPKTKAQEKEFFDVNVKGTENLLKTLERSATLPESFVFISSIAVYGAEEGILIDESFPLSANDAYGKSKIGAEKLIIDWCELNKINCTILRLPLLAGSNPPGNLRAMIKGIQKGYYVNIAGGKAKKSMVMREDVVSIILKASQKGGIYNLTDGHHPSFAELSEVISKQLNKPNPFNIPLWFAKLMAFGGDLIGNKAPINSKKLGKITKDLTFADDKARTALGWKPEPVLERFKI